MTEYRIENLLATNQHSSQTKRENVIPETLEDKSWWMITTIIEHCKHTFSLDQEFGVKMFYIPHFRFDSSRFMMNQINVFLIFEFHDFVILFCKHLCKFCLKMYGLYSKTSFFYFTISFFIFLLFIQEFQFKIDRNKLKL